eukprot:7623831-Ditylum_brightwellii.AAC.1
MASTTEAELGALFENAKEAISIRNALVEMGHPQPPTPIQVDNAVAHGIMQDQVKQKQFVVYWEPGSNNRADYFTKYHPPEHHCKVQ